MGLYTIATDWILNLLGVLEWHNFTKCLFLLRLCQITSHARHLLLEWNRFPQNQHWDLVAANVPFIFYVLFSVCDEYFFSFVVYWISLIAAVAVGVEWFIEEMQQCFLSKIKEMCLIVCSHQVFCNFKSFSWFRSDYKLFIKASQIASSQ